MLNLILLPVVLILKLIYIFVKILEFTGVLFAIGYIPGFIIATAINRPVLFIIAALIIIGYLGG